MTETKEEKILNIDDKQLTRRMEFLRGKLLETSKVLRAKVPSNLSDQDLTENGFFKQWIICNTVYDSSLRDANNEDFNRMLYYMFDESNGRLDRLLNQYDVRVEMNESGELSSIELIVLETETSNE